MYKNNSKILILATAFLCLTCGNYQSETERSREIVNELADEYIESYFDAYPFMALLSNAPDLHPEKLADNSREGIAQLEKKQLQLLTRLNAINPELMDSETQNTYFILKNLLENSLAICTCRMELWNVSPTWTGWQSLFSLMASLLPIETPEQKNKAIKRLSQIPVYLEMEIRNLRAGIQLNYSAPANNVRVVIEQMNALIAGGPENLPYTNIAGESNLNFKEKLESLASLKIIPAIENYRDFLQDEYLIKTRTSFGVNENRDGIECYKASLKYYTTTNFSPKEIHELGLMLVAGILAEVKNLGQKVMGIRDVRKIFFLMNSEPSFRFNNREEILINAERSIESVRAKLQDWFNVVPETKIKVQPFPDFQEKFAPAGEAVAAPEEGGTGLFYINTYNANEQSRAGLQSIVFHESIPGHLFQFAVAAGKKSHPICKYFYLSGHGEGWALYAERLADEMNLYSTDVERLGMLSNQLLRAARLVVDTGIHAFSWSRDESIDYLMSNAGLQRSAAEAEVDRYIAVPGQATAYMVGYLEIINLRDAAEKKLGKAFVLKEFHDLMLEEGTLPLWLLREKAESWIQRNIQK